MENCYLWLDLCWHTGVRVSDLPCNVEGIDLCITAENGNAYHLMSVARAEMIEEGSWSSRTKGTKMPVIAWSE